MNVCVIIAAAGRSARFGQGDKLSQDLGGRAVLLRSVELFTKRDEVRSIVVAGPAEEFESFREKFGPALGFHGAKLVKGGRDHRWETVRNALNEPDAVPADATHIAVHDAARPAASAELIERVFSAAATLDAVIPVVPISATLKRITAEAEQVRADDDDALADAILGDVGKVSFAAREVIATIDRTNLVEVQTPQVFRAELLRRAYAQDDLVGATDDAELIQRLGEKVHAVEGDACNLKITRPADLRLVRAILNLPPPAERPVHKRF